MKKLAVFVAVVMGFVAVAAYAADYSGNYTFVSRAKKVDGKMTADLAGYKGTMKIENNVMRRDLTSPDGKDKRFYVSKMTPDTGNLVTIKHTDAYKPNYIGNEFKNNFIKNGDELKLEAPDQSFQEVWRAAK